MTTIIEFIRARLEEDHEAAEAAGATAWEVIDRGHSVRIADAEFGVPVAEWDQAELPPFLRFLSSAPVVQHIARHDPASVLQQTAALRSLVRFLAQSVETVYDVDYSPEVGSRAEESLRQLAAIWAAHPDYQEAWKP